MKSRQLKDLEISTYFKSDAIQFIQRWINLKNNDEFLKRVYFTLRDIHTTIKNYEAPINSNSIFFQKRTADKVPRFDQILAMAKESTRLANSKSQNKAYNRTEKFDNIRELVEGSEPHKTYAPIYDVKEYKQKFLRGQDYNITEYVEPKGVKQSSYQAEL